MSQAPEPLYRERLALLEATHSKAQVAQSRLTLLLGCAVLLTVIAVAGAAQHSLPLWWMAPPVLLFLAVVPFFLKGRRIVDRAARLISLYENGLARITGEPIETPQTGEDFRDPAHLYDRDLNLLGPDSLFARLASTRTGLGQRALAQILLTPPPADETAFRQQAIQHLTPLVDLREQIALLGANSSQHTHPETFELWLDEPSAPFPNLLRPILTAASIAVLGLLVAWYTNRIAVDTLLPNLACVLALQGAIALRYRARVTPILEATQPLPRHLQILRDGLALLHQQAASSHLLGTLQTQSAQADAALAQLQSHLFLVEQRKTEWFYLPALAFNVGTHAAVRIQQWKTQHGEAMRQWIDAWGSFDALNAFATYAFENPENLYPELLPATAPPTFEATSLSHPLLHQGIPNDIALNPATRFYLISGSNMAGKSTLLRSIGLAVVLARAGAPIPAKSCRLTPLALGASLALTDSLAEGKSRFFSEVERLQHIVVVARHAPTLFLIDELFSGTNSADRLTAAKAVLEALLAAGALGALSTHDLALTTLVTDANHGENVHMASPDPDDPLAFDYLLKSGVNTTTNALAFLRLLNLS